VRGRAGRGEARHAAQGLTAVRLGVFGGSFDPPHLGHLLAASDAFETLALDRLLFIPAGMQPFKARTVEGTGAQRLRMLDLTIDGDPRFAADPIEIERTGLSYTVDTLHALAARHPEAQRFLLIGEDLAEQIARWRAPARIAELAQIVVLVRGSERAAEPGSGGSEGAGGQDGGSAVPLRRIATRRIDVSSSEIRARVRAGQSIHGFVMPAVDAFIRSAGLYR
jgi:nicotinate-nucleotide adenylyltransferase